MKLSSSELRRQRQDMQIIFQDPYSSLDPRFTVAQAIGEPFRIHRLAMNKGEQHKKVLKLMDTVGLARRLINSYPHELDGGRRQRIGIARALALGPRFYRCDEPVSLWTCPFSPDIKPDEATTGELVSHTYSSPTI